MKYWTDGKHLFMYYIKDGVSLYAFGLNFILFIMRSMALHFLVNPMRISGRIIIQMFTQALLLSLN